MCVTSRSRRSAPQLWELSADDREIIVASVSTVEEIRSAIAHLNSHDRALLTAELFAGNLEPDEQALKAALDRGFGDVAAGRVRSIEEVKAMIPRWTSKS